MIESYVMWISQIKKKFHRIYLKFHPAQTIETRNYIKKFLDQKGDMIFI